MPELRQLRAFVAVAEELSFTRAGERLFLRQQAVSKAVRQLEGELGVTLLERTTREVHLTPAGDELLRTGREALAAADHAFDGARRVGHGTAGTIRLGVSPAVGRSELDGLVRLLRVGAPDVSVTLSEVWPDQVVALLRDRELDLAVARIAPHAPEIGSAALPPTPAHLYVPADHRLAERAGPVEPVELDGERLLTFGPPGSPYTDLLLSQLAAAGASVHPVAARVLGMAAGLTDLAEARAVALGPPRWPHDDAIVELALGGAVELPVRVMWPGERPPAVVERLRSATGG